MSGLFGGASNPSGIAGGLSTGVKLAAMALLAHQLMKHARAEGSTASAGATSGGGAVGKLGGLLDGLRNQGFGRHVDSWVTPGGNHPIAPHELENAFELAELDEAVRHAGTDRGTLLNELSGMLPGMVVRMTPVGRVPQREEDLGQDGIGGLLGHLLGGGR